MMDVIVLSHMYPRKKHPYSGIFVEKQVLALREITGGNITVISPVPWAPRFLWFRRKWREYGTAEMMNVREGITVYYPRYFAIPGKFFFPLLCVFMYLSVKGLILEFAKKNKGKTILHAHTVLPAGLAAVLLKRQAGLKIVCTAHGSDINLYPSKSKICYALTKYVLERADSVVAVSGNLKEKIRNIIGRKDVTVITNGANVENAAAKDIGTSDDQKGGAISILFVGTLCFRKGIRELLHAFRLLKNKYKDLRLIMLGNNSMKKWIETFVSHNHLDSAVELPGVVDSKEITKYYSRASIFALPSYSEGMPTVMFEAMANKLPIVISRVGGVEEVIRDGINGMLVNPGSVQDLYDKLELLVEDERLRDMLSANAFEEFSANYTWGQNARKTIALYGRLVK